MKAIKKVFTESVLGAQAQNYVAHSMALFLVAYYLTKHFRAFPDICTYLWNQLYVRFAIGQSELIWKKLWQTKVVGNSQTKV